jgi:hypothetical protein
LCVTTNFAVVEPPASRTDAGTVASFVLELLSVTVSPPGGAGPVKVIVPETTVPEPPTTVLGAISIASSDGG